MNEQAIQRENFGGTELVARGETASTALAAAQKATIEARCIMAINRPRNLDKTRIVLLKECERSGFAESAIYRKPMGRKKNEETGEWEQNYVEGLSIRFAEASLRHMGNLYTSSQSIYDDDDKSIVRVTAMDLESNATNEVDVTITKTIERRELKRGQRPLRTRTNSYGEPVFILPATDDEVLNKTNNLVSKALRNAILRLVPGDIQDECEAACRKTMLSQDQKDPDAAKKRLLDGFARIGVLPDQIASYLGVQTITTLEPAQLAELRAVYAAIRDGETTWAAVVDAKAPVGENETADEKRQRADVARVLDRHGKGKRQEGDGAPADGPAAPETSTNGAKSATGGAQPAAGEPTAAPVASGAAPTTDAPAEAPKAKGRKG